MSSAIARFASGLKKPLVTLRTCLRQYGSAAGHDAQALTFAIAAGWGTLRCHAGVINTDMASGFLSQMDQTVNDMFKTMTVRSVLRPEPSGCADNMGRSLPPRNGVLLRLGFVDCTSDPSQSKFLYKMSLQPRPHSQGFAASLTAALGSRLRG